MKFKVNEIFYSLQGEGRFSGTPAVFVRLSGCNLACPFCDTVHQNGTMMDAQAIVGQVGKYPSRHIVVTGGEPGLQLSSEFVELLHSEGYFVQVETNGTVALPENIDWITCSPKTGSISCGRVDELKLLFMGDGSDEQRIGQFADMEVKYRCLQPCDHSGGWNGGMQNLRDKNRLTVEACVEYVKAHPEWRLSIQLHKVLNIA